MSVCVVTFAPDIDTVLCDKLREFLNSTVGFSELFPKTGKLRISPNHPFVELMSFEGQGQASAALPNLFPSVTVSSVQDSRGAGQTATLSDENEVSASDLSEIVAASGYLIPASQKTALTKYLTDPGESVPSKSVSVIRTHQVALEIWSDNKVLKDRIFDLCMLGISGSIRFDLKPSGITIREEEMRGQRSGNYCRDFGKLLYGAVLNFPVDITYWQTFIDTGTTTITAVDVELEGEEV